MSPARKRFVVASGLPPSAEETAGVTTPRRQDAVTSDKPRRSAFTWRLTAQQAAALDMMTARLKLELGRPKVDRAEMLAALVALADENPGIFGALVARMQADKAS